MGSSVLKVAITGPESTGKSTLAAQLASHYQTVWVPEFARTYIATLPGKYTAEDVQNIARGQLEAYKAATGQANKILLADTDLLVIKIWMLHAFNYCPKWIADALAQQDFDFYLLMNVDLPWEEDPQREHPHLRQYFYDWYKSELQQYNFNFVEISGTYQNRLHNAINHIDKHLAKENRA